MKTDRKSKEQMKKNQFSEEEGEDSSFEMEHLHLLGVDFLDSSQFLVTSAMSFTGACLLDKYAKVYSPENTIVQANSKASLMETSKFCSLRPESCWATPLAGL